MTISVAIITKNEEKHIERCLKSVAWADEIIIVDSGSTDRTIEIAKRYTDKVIHQDWLGFAEQRNFSLTKVTCDWVLVIDADEEVTEQLKDSILAVTNSTSNKVAYTIIRKNYFMGKILNCYIEKKLRLFKNGTTKFEGDVHERPIFQGEIGNLQGDLFHYQYSNLDNQLNKSNQYSTLQAKELFAKGKKCGVAKIIFLTIFEFTKRYFIKGGLLDGFPGLVSSILRGHYTFSKYTKLYELNKQR